MPRRACTISPLVCFALRATLAMAQAATDRYGSVEIPVASVAKLAPLQGAGAR